MIITLAALLVIGSLAYYYSCYGDDCNDYYYLVIDYAKK